MKLHELDQLFTELENEFESLDQSDLTPELEQKILDLLATRDAVTDDYKTKVDNYCKLIANLDAIATLRKAEADRLKALAETDLAKVDFLKNRLKDSLKQNGLTKLRTDSYNLSVCNNSVPPLVYDTDSIPSEYQRVKVEVDVKRLREALKNGVDIPGVGFGERGDHIRIK
jgi:hypothetical protein